MDRIFPDWLQLCFSNHGSYFPYDMNQPLRLPSRPGGATEFHDDPPLTEMGILTSQMLGKGFAIKGMLQFSIHNLKPLMSNLRIIQMNENKCNIDFHSPKQHKKFVNLHKNVYMSRQMYF